MFYVAPQRRSLNLTSHLPFTQASGPSEPRPEEGAGELAYALDEFLDRVNMDPVDFNEVRHRPSLEERLESIIRFVLC